MCLPYTVVHPWPLFDLLQEPVALSLSLLPLLPHPIPLSPSMSFLLEGFPVSTVSSTWAPTSTVSAVFAQALGRPAASPMLLTAISIQSGQLNLLLDFNVSASTAHDIELGNDWA